MLLFFLLFCRLVPLWFADPSSSTPFDESFEPGSGPLSLSTRHQRHAGSSLVALDMNGDGDKDVLNGDILGSNFLFFENCGTPDSAWVCAQDSAFPSYDVPAFLLDVAGPHYFDGNNDGSNDLIVSNFFLLVKIIIMLCFMATVPIINLMFLPM
jgi:hypothetical protein